MSTPTPAQPAQPPEQPHPTMQLKAPAAPERPAPHEPPAEPEPAGPATLRKPPAPDRTPSPVPAPLPAQTSAPSPAPAAAPAPLPQAPPHPFPPQQPYAPAAGLPGGGTYASPIPVRRTHLGHALASEWTKIRSVRSTVWTLGIFLLLVVGIGLLTAIGTSDREYTGVPYTVPAFIGLVLGQICLITLGVLVITSEYGTGMIRTTFTASPQRHRVLAAKIIVYFAVAFAVSTLAVELVGLATSAIHSGASTEPWAGTVLKGALYVSLLGVLSLAVGTLLRHSAGAITTMLGVVLVPAILPAFLLISKSTQKIGEKMLEYNAPNSLAKILAVGSGTETGTKQLWLLIVVTAVTVGAAFVRLARRDV